MKRFVAREWLWFLGCILSGVISFVVWVQIEEAAFDWPGRIGWSGIFFQAAFGERGIGLGTLFGIVIYAGIGIIRLTLWAIKTASAE